LYVFLVNVGKHLTLKPVEFRQVSSCSIELEGVETFQADGELYKADKLEITMLPKALTLI
jgi:diacylglycerol kinase family enzyme